MKRVLVCGGRFYRDFDRIREAIRRVHEQEPIEVIIEGEARGADTLARIAAEELGIAVAPYPADWKQHGKAAGSIRNQQMLDEGKPNLVLAFPDINSRGTWDMVNRAKKAGVEVRVEYP